MNRKNLIVFPALLLGALFTLAVQAQDSRKPAAESAAASAPDPGQDKVIEKLMECLAEGLPEGWQKAWFTITEIGRKSNLAEGTTRQFEGNFFYATDPNDAKGKPLTSCGANRIIDGVLSLNNFLLPSQRRWTGVTMNFAIDGSYSAKYDYAATKPAPATSKATPKPAAKKKQETAK